MILAHIAAMSKNRVIGKDNALPWHIPGDLKWFKSKTKGRVLIMGRKTFESMSKPLPNRYHIIVTRNPDYQVDFEDCKVAHSLQDAVEFAKTLTGQWGEEVFITGGSEIYQQSLEITNRIYLTVIDKEYEGDAYYPEVDLSAFEEFDCAEEHAPIPYAIHSYQRKS